MVCHANHTPEVLTPMYKDCFNSLSACCNLAFCFFSACDTHVCDGVYCRVTSCLIGYERTNSASGLSARPLVKEFKLDRRAQHRQMDIDPGDNDGQMPLMLAACGNESTMKLLPDTDPAQSEGSHSPLHPWKCCENGTLVEWGYKTTSLETYQHSGDIIFAMDLRLSYNSLGHQLRRNLESAAKRLKNISNNAIDDFSRAIGQPVLQSMNARLKERILSTADFVSLLTVTLVKHERKPKKHNKRLDSLRSRYTVSPFTDNRRTMHINRHSMAITEQQNMSLTTPPSRSCNDSSEIAGFRLAQCLISTTGFGLAMIIPRMILYCFIPNKYGSLRMRLYAQ
jgi:hypothetical protein